jgi:hypothetical protein
MTKPDRRPARSAALRDERASRLTPTTRSLRTSCRRPRSGIGARHRSCFGGQGSSAPGAIDLHETRRGASQPEPTEGWASRHAERPAIRGEPQIRTFQRDVQLGSPVGSPPPEHQPYLVQRDATPRVGRAPCHGALPLATPRGPLTRSGRAQSAAPARRPSERSADPHRPRVGLTRQWHCGARVSSVAPREGEGDAGRWSRPRCERRRKPLR